MAPGGGLEDAGNTFPLNVQDFVMRKLGRGARMASL